MDSSHNDCVQTLSICQSQCSDFVIRRMIRCEMNVVHQVSVHLFSSLRIKALSLITWFITIWQINASQEDAGQILSILWSHFLNWQNYRCTSNKWIVLRNYRFNYFTHFEQTVWSKLHDASWHNKLWILNKTRFNYTDFEQIECSW